MRKLILVILCLFLFIPPAYGWMAVPVCGGGYAAAPACSTPTDGDRYNQGWETGEATTGWTKTAASDPEVSDDAATLPGTPPTGACAKGYRVSSTGTILKNSYDTAVASTSTYFKFTFYVDSHSLSASQAASIYVSGANTDGTIIMGAIQLRNNAGQLTIRAISGANVSSALNISVDTWYTVSGYIEKSTTANANWFTLDGGAQQTWTAIDTIANARYHHVGVLTASRTADVYFGHVQGDSNGF